MCVCEGNIVCVCVLELGSSGRKFKEQNTVLTIHTAQHREIHFPSGNIKRPKFLVPPALGSHNQSPV